MSAQSFKYVYGPVPSRRLGRSLGIDLIPSKICTYDCVYCQLGRTTNKTVERTTFGSVEEILDEVKRKLDSDSLPPDYIGISGSGEPTLSSDIGEVIEGIKRVTSVPVAVLTNGSLLWMNKVQDALMASDLVLPSLDAGDAASFEYVNRPHSLLCFEEMVDGIASFTKRYRGKVWLEVLLLAGVTGIPSEAKKIAALARRIGPGRVQLNTVCRPPAEQFALSLSQSEMLALKALFWGGGGRHQSRPPVPAWCAGRRRNPQRRYPRFTPKKTVHGQRRRGRPGRAYERSAEAARCSRQSRQGDNNRRGSRGLLRRRRISERSVSVG